MARLIDADALREKAQYSNRFESDEQIVFLDDIDTAPTVNAMPAMEVQHGKWEFAGYTAFHGTPYKSCSLCKKVYLMEDTVFNYCPNCGAKMDGDVNNG